MAQGRSHSGRSSWSVGAPVVMLQRILLALVASLMPALASAQVGDTFIAGTVTDASSAPIAGLVVRACAERPFGVICFQDASDEAGHYAIDLPGWPSHLFTTGNLTERGLVNEVYDNVPCPGVCSDEVAVALGGTLVEVATGTTVERNIQLSAGGTLSGTVTDAATSAAVRQVIVSAYTRVGEQVVLAGAATTNAAGAYSLGGLTAATHFAVTSNGVGYTNEIYDDILCIGDCSPATAEASGAPIPIAAGTTSGNRHFALARGGAVTGVVRSNANFAPINGAIVDVYARVNGELERVGSASTGASGFYLVSGLPTGTYYAVARARFHVAKGFGEVPCALDCTPARAGTGTPIHITAGGAVLVDFGLDRGGRLFGAVSIQGFPGFSGIPMRACTRQGATALCTAPDAALTQNSGFYEITGLPPGSYFVFTDAQSGFQNEVHANVACTGSCLESIAAWSGATPLTVASDTNAELPFDLDLSAMIGGLVSTGGVRMANVPVSLYDASGNLLLTRKSDAVGVYELWSVPAGTYRVATGSTAGVVNEVWNNVACAASGVACDAATIAAGTPLNVIAGGIYDGTNFVLAPASAPPHAPAHAGATVEAFTVQFAWDPPLDGPTATGYVIEVGTTPGTTAVTFESAELSFAVPGAPPGLFYARIKARNAFGIGPASPEFPLLIAADGSGAPNPPTNVQGFTSGSQLTMTWAAPKLGTPTGYVVEAGTASGQSNVGALPVSSRSFVFDPVPPGFYFLRVRSLRGTQQSAPSTEVMINVGNVPAPPPAPHALTHTVSSSTVKLSWDAAPGPVTGYALDIGLVPGIAAIPPVVVGNTLTTTFTAVPPGTYYVRVRAFNGLGASVASNERTITVP